MLGLGTALVYPTLLAAVGDIAHRTWRAASVGVHRSWRDAGFAVGALLTGLIADMAGAPTAICAAAVLTAASGVVVVVRMSETLRRPPSTAYLTGSCAVSPSPQGGTPAAAGRRHDPGQPRTTRKSR